MVLVYFALKYNVNTVVHAFQYCGILMQWYNVHKYCISKNTILP